METKKTNYPVSTPKVMWVNIIFFAITTFGGLIGGPLYVYRYGFSWGLFALFAFYMIATGLSITVGYHRHFSHAAFRTNRFIQFLMLFFGAAAFEQTAYKWSAQHRDHHQHVDTDKDPYSIKKGFWYAHIGWLMFWDHESNYANAKDLEKNSLVMHQNNHYLLWSLGAGVVTPVLIGALMGQALGAFIFAVCLRITFVYHSTFFINSICHMFGKSTYDIYSTAKDHWFIAFLTYGEGYHNFHHRFPSDYRNAVRWYQWDPSKWVIAGLEKLGLASHLSRVSDFSILNARLSAENQRAKDKLAQTDSGESQIEHALEILKGQYVAVRGYLSQWEVATREYKTLMANRVSHKSEELLHTAADNLEKAKSQFVSAYENWKKLRELKEVELFRRLLAL